MAFIKSALEIALERTRDVKSDHETIRSDELVKKGQKIASDYLFENNSEDDNLKSLVNKYKGKDKDSVISGLKKTFIANIHLPNNDDYKNMVTRIEEGLCSISKNSKSISAMMEQISQFYSQYTDNKSQLIDALKQQYEPRLRQKEQELAAKYGQQMTLSPEQDPEFMEILKSNLGKLESQYSESLSRAKVELEKLI